MNREQMIEKGVLATLVETDEEESLAQTLGFDENYARKVVVPMIIDAILPQVTTVEELEALPIGTALLAEMMACSVAYDHGRSARLFAFTNGRHEYSANRMLREFGPLTVVWTP